MIIQGKFSSVLQKNICCGYSLELPHQVPTTYFFMEKYGKLSLDYHQIPTLSVLNYLYVVDLH